MNLEQILEWVRQLLYKYVKAEDQVWVDWLILFFLKEIPAVTDGKPGGTFSELVWKIGNLRPWTKFVSWTLLADLYFHLAFHTPLWPF